MKVLSLILFLILLLTFPCHLAKAEGTFTHKLCTSQGFFCQRIHNHQSWQKLFPDPETRMMVMEINRINTPIYAGDTIAIPIHLSTAKYLDYSPFPNNISAPGQKLVIVDPTVLAWAAYDSNGNLIRWGGASLGSDYCRDLGHRCHSPVGTFHVYEKGSVDCHSTKFPLPYGGAPMPYCMYFHGGFALHGEPNGVPGYNASHGCVRLFVEDAEWLSKEFVDLGTEVIVGPYGAFTHPATSNLEQPAGFVDKE